MFLNKTIKLNEGVIKIIVDECNKVTIKRVTGTIEFSDVYKILGEILSPIGNTYSYSRKNPYRFINDNPQKIGVYVEWAEANQISGNILKRYKMFNVSHNGSVMNFTNVFLFDILDYLVYKDFLRKENNQYIKIHSALYEEIEYISKDDLVKLGFMNI